MSRQKRSRLFGSRPARRGNQRAQLRQASAEIFEERKLMSAVMASADDVSQSAAEEQTARAEFQVRVTDTAGQPISQVEVGDEFVIEIVAHDRFETPTGFFTAYTDVTYNADLVDIAESDNTGQLSKLGKLFSNNTPDGPGAVSPVLATLQATATSSGILEIGTNPAESNAKELVVYGHPEIDLRDEADYGSFRLLIGSPTVALEASPSINDAEQKTEIVLKIDASGVQASDFSADGLLAGISEGLVARRQSDGATIETTVERVDVVTAGESVRVTLSIDEPTGGFGTDHNGTWDIQSALLSGTDGDVTTIGSFEIDFEVVNIETSIRFEDTSGAALSTVEVGQEFRIVISGQDLRDMEETELLGLLSAAYDIQYDTDLIDATGLIHNYGSSTRGENFNDADGLIQDAGGFFGTQAPGSSDPVDVVTVLAIARSKGTLSVSATPSDSKFSIYTPGIRSARDVREFVQSGSASLEVVDGLEVTIDTTTVAENGGMASVTVTRGQFSVNEAETLAVNISDNSELSGPTSVTFAAGQRSISFELRGVDDNILDGTESVTVSVATAGRTRGSLNVEVTDHEELSLSVVEVEVPENAGDFQLTLRRGDVDDLSSPVSVELSVPEELRDRIELPNDVVIAANEESTVIIVGVKDNDVADGNHVISITASASGFVSATTSFTIIDVENPDVVVTAFAALDDRIDDGTRVKFTLQNRGTGVASDFDVNIIHSDDATIGNVDDQVRLTVHVDELGAGESVTLFADVDFDVQTLVDRFISENENTGDPGEDAMSQMVDYLAGVVDAENSDRNLDVPKDDVTALPFDVNGDGVVTPRDALNAISAIGKSAEGDRIAFDTDDDDAITPLDAATVIGHIGLSLNEDVVEGPTDGTSDPIVNSKVSVFVSSPNSGGTIRIDRVALVGDEIWVLSKQGQVEGDVFADVVMDISDSIVVGIPSLPIRHFVQNDQTVFTNEDGSGDFTGHNGSSQVVSMELSDFEQQLAASTETFYLAEKSDDVIPNVAPTIASIDKQSLIVGETRSLTISVAASDPPLSELSVTATSSDDSLVSVDLDSSGGSGASQLHLARIASGGSASVTVTVSDGTSETSTTFDVGETIVDVFPNEAPSISSIDNLELTAGETTSMSLTIADSDTPLSDVSVTVTSNDDAILPEGSIAVEGTGAERTLSLSPIASGGPVSVTVTVNDGEASAATTFDVLVVAEGDNSVDGDTQTEGSNNAISSLRFDGESTVAWAGNSSNLQIDNDLTVSTWINPSDVRTFQKFISKGESGKGFAWALGIQKGKLHIGICEDGVGTNAGKVNIFQGSPAVPLGEWSHVAWTFKDGTNRLFLNGNELSLQQVRYGNGQRVEKLHTGGTTLQLGIEGFGVANAIRHFNGEMAETSIWKSALSIEEVKQLHNDGVVPNLSNHPSVDQLVSWWSMEVNNEGTEVVDRTGGNPLSLIGLNADDVVQDSGLRGAETTIDSVDESTHLNESSESVASDEEGADSASDSSDVDDSPAQSIVSSKTSTGAPSHAVTGSKTPVTSSKSRPRSTSSTGSTSRPRTIPTGGTASRAATGTGRDSADPQGIARDTTSSTGAASVAATGTGRDSAAPQGVARDTTTGTGAASVAATGTGRDSAEPQGIARDPSTGTGAASHAADVLEQRAIDDVFKDGQLLDDLNGSRTRPIDTSGTSNGLVNNKSSNATGNSRLGGAKSQAAAYLDWQKGLITKAEYDMFTARFETFNTDAVNRKADTSLAKG